MVTGGSWHGLRADPCPSVVSASTAVLVRRGRVVTSGSVPEPAAGTDVPCVCPGQRGVAEGCASARQCSDACLQHV